MKRFLIPLLLGLILTTQSLGAPTTQPATTHPATTHPAPKLNGIIVEHNIQYVPGNDPAQRLDLYLPEKTADKPQPLLIWIHGGGWFGGSKIPCPSTPFVYRGYIVASIEYRFSNKALFPAQIQDCQAAIRWLRAHHAKYNIDPDRVGVVGASAGGHLSALIGTSGGQKAFPPIGGNEDQSDQVQAVVDLFGPTDFMTVIDQADRDKTVKNVFVFNSTGDPYSLLIGAKLGVDKDKCDAASPIHFVTKDAAPILILHGTADQMVPYAQSVEFFDALQKAGVESTLQTIPNARHGGAQFELPVVQKLVMAFLDKHLKGVDVKIEALPESALTTPKH